MGDSNFIQARLRRRFVQVKMGQKSVACWIDDNDLRAKNLKNDDVGTLMAVNGAQWFLKIIQNINDNCFYYE